MPAQLRRPAPFLIAAICALLSTASASAAPASAGEVPPPETAPPADELVDDPAALEAAYQLLRPVTALGWTFTGVGLTFMGLGWATQGKVDLGPLPVIGGVLFMSSLFVTSVVGSQALKLLPTRFRGRPARTVASVAFVIGMATLVTEAVLRLLVFGAIVADEPMPPSLSITLQAVGYGGLITASLITQIDNSVLLGQLARERQGGATAGGPVVGLAPALMPGGGALFLVGRF